MVTREGNERIRRQCLSVTLYNIDLGICQPDVYIFRDIMALASLVQSRSDTLNWASLNCIAANEARKQQTNYNIKSIDPSINQSNKHIDLTSHAHLRLYKNGIHPSIDFSVAGPVERRAVVPNLPHVTLKAKANCDVS